MLFLANYLTAIFFLLLFIAFKLVEASFDADVFIAFCVGWIFGCAFFQGAHRVRYGYWFDAPTIDPDP